jgi:2'-5' RNA ligase
LKLLIFVLEVENLPDEEFREWPLHCTLVYWFKYGGDMTELIQKFTEFFADFDSQELLGGSTAYFGPRQDLAVTLVNKTQSLQKFHDETVNKVLELSGEFESDEFMRSNFTPHVTEHGGRKLENGTPHVSKGVYLVESLSESPKIRKLVHKFSLKES